MGLFGSLFTGVSALNAQSQNTAIISNNIANISTVGFKRSEASFNSLVTTESRLSRFSPGTVAVNRIQRVDQQGAIQQTSSATDAAISGNGMFPVKRSTDFGQEFLYTRAGQFSEDASGLLRNASGFVLYAWPIDSSGNLPADQGDLTSLVPADVAFLGGLTRPTNTAELAINLNADQEAYINDNFTTPSVLPIPDTQPAHFSRGLTVFDSLGSAQNLTFEYRKITGPMAHATSNTGFTMNLTDNVVGGGAASGILSGISDNDTFTIQTHDGTETFEFVDAAGTAAAANEIVTVQDLVDEINNFDGADGDTGGILEARVVNGQLLIQAVDPIDSFEIINTTNTPMAGANTFNLVSDVTGVPESTSAVYTATTDLLSTAANVAAGDVLTLTIAGTATNLNVANAGANIGVNPPTIVSVQDLIDYVNATGGGLGIAGLSAAFDTTSGRIRYSLTDPNASFTATGTATVGDDSLGFGTTGLLFEPEAPVTPTNTGGVTYSANDPYPNQDDFPSFAETGAPNTQGWWEMTISDPNGVEITKGLVNFSGSGALNAASDTSGNVDINLSNIDWGNGSELQNIDVDVSRFSQFAGNYDVIFSDQNGAELGLRTGVEITREGTVVARFSNGASSDLYQIPLITFANTNGLTEVSGTAYTEAEESGEENLREAGSGGAGFVEPSTLEASNVDLADEFAELIVSQRAFGAGTRLINTVDQMTEDLLRLR